MEKDINYYQAYKKLKDDFVIKEQEITRLKNTLKELESQLEEEQQTSKHCLQRYMKLVVEHNLLN